MIFAAIDFLYMIGLLFFLKKNIAVITFIYSRLLIYAHILIQNFWQPTVEPFNGNMIWILKSDSEYEIMIIRYYYYIIITLQLLKVCKLVLSNSKDAQRKPSEKKTHGTK